MAKTYGSIQSANISSVFTEFAKLYKTRDNPREDARDIVRFAKRKLSIELKYVDVKDFLEMQSTQANTKRIIYESEGGQQLLHETMAASSDYQRFLIDTYRKQTIVDVNKCAIKTLTHVLNARLIASAFILSRRKSTAHNANPAENKVDFIIDSDEEESDTEIDESDSDDDDEDELIKKLRREVSRQWISEYSAQLLLPFMTPFLEGITESDIINNGVSLETLSQLFGKSLACLSVKTSHCNLEDETLITYASQFRSACRRIFESYHVDTKGAIVVHFDPPELDETYEIKAGKHGLISAVGAYHASSDRVLLLDVCEWRCWVRIDDLCQAMAGSDDESEDFLSGTPGVPPQPGGWLEIEGIPVWDGGAELKEQGFSSKRRQTVAETNETKEDGSESEQLKISADSEMGTTFFDECMDSEPRFYQRSLVNCYTTQNGTTTDGVVTIAMILNSQITNKYPQNKSLLISETDMLDNLWPKYCDLILPLRQLLSCGMSLRECHSLLSKDGFNCTDVKAIYVESYTEEVIATFRQTLERELTNDESFIVASFDMSELGFGLSVGHISPIGGYHLKSDRVLLLDVYELVRPVWVPLTTLVKSMNTVMMHTTDRYKYRGYLVCKGVPIIDKTKLPS